MARPIVLGNGELHVGINKFGEVHDFYYPYVGLENHSAGQFLRHHVGVWVDGVLSWLDSGDWQIRFSYPHQALVGHIVALNTKIGIVLEFDDMVDAEFSSFVRNIQLINQSDRPRDVRLFMHQAFAIGDSRSNTDTAQYLPDTNAILHYRGRRAFVISGQSSNGQFFDQYTVGLFGIEGREGTYKDAEDGELQMCTVEHGRVDSTIRFRANIAVHDSIRVHYWIACGTSTREALYIHKQLVNKGASGRFDATARWWQKWLEPANKSAAKLDESRRKSFLESVMLIKAQIDKRGAVIASTDSSMLNYGRDAYAYCWPRDGAHVLWPLIRMGYVDEPYRFFEFCRRVLHADGYLMHKYRADGALGSSWHTYLHDYGVVAAPIQEDETALVLFVFGQFFAQDNSKKLLAEFYDSLVTPMANFLAGYIDNRTGLPRASYDLWEERFQTTTYTTGIVYGALLAASDMAEVYGDEGSAVRWRAVAEDIYEAAHKHLYNEERHVFYRGVNVDGNGDVIVDDVVDLSSFYGAYMFGLFPVGGLEITESAKAIQSIFGLDSGAIGLPRYENDNYYRRSTSGLGNYWFVTSLWMAQYWIETDEPTHAESTIDWVGASALETGVLSEQVDPKTGEILSVAPLNWSQAEYVSTLLDTITDESHDG